MEISGVSGSAYTSAAASVEDEEKLQKTKEEQASEESKKTEKQEGDKVELSSKDDEYTESEVEEKVQNYIQNILYTSNLTEASKAQLQQYLNTFDVAKFIKSYGPFNSTAEISAAMYAVTAGLIKRQEDE